MAFLFIPKRMRFPSSNLSFAFFGFATRIASRSLRESQRDVSAMQGHVPSLRVPYLARTVKIQLAGNLLRYPLDVNNRALICLIRLLQPLL
jgi:hypothetical protein